MMSRIELKFVTTPLARWRPKYASECLNYENLWKEVSETFTNEEDEEVMTISKLEAEPATKEATIPDYHPCEVAKNAGGIFGPYGGGRGDAGDGAVPLLEAAFAALAALDMTCFGLFAPWHCGVNLLYPRRWFNGTREYDVQRLV